MTEENEHIIEEQDIEMVEEEKKDVVDKGILLYHTVDGVKGYSFVNQDNVTLQDVAFYKRYLDQVEQSLWDSQGGVKYVKDKE